MWQKIKCPYCSKGILIEYEDVISGKLRGKCSHCKTFAIYNVEQNTFTTITNGNNKLIAK